MLLTYDISAAVLQKLRSPPRRPEQVKEIIFKTIKEKKYGKYKLHKRLRRSSLPHKI